jgi:hypothetical protein
MAINPFTPVEGKGRMRRQDILRFTGERDVAEVLQEIEVELHERRIDGVTEGR